MDGHQAIGVARNVAGIKFPGGGTIMPFIRGVGVPMPPAGRVLNDLGAARRSLRRLTASVLKLTV